MALAVYVFVLPLTAEWLFNGAEKVFGVSLDRGARDLAYYAVLFGLVLIAFWGFFGRNTRAFFDRPWQVLGAAGVGMAAFYGLNELVCRILGLLNAGQVNLNDQAILTRLGTSPRSTILMVVFWPPWWRRRFSGDMCSGISGSTAGARRMWFPACFSP